MFSHKRDRDEWRNMIDIIDISQHALAPVTRTQVSSSSWLH
jgi:hypothetical protein